MQNAMQTGSGRQKKLFNFDV